jgi:hypothetical protein
MVITHGNRGILFLIDYLIAGLNTGAVSFSAGAESVHLPSLKDHGADIPHTEEARRRCHRGVLVMLWGSHYEGIKQLINVNPVLITWERYPLVDNGFGEMIEDTTATPEEKKAVVRISHQSGGVQDTKVAPTGLTTNLSEYVVMLPNVDVREGEIITAKTGTIRKWKVGVVDDLIIEGRPYARQAPLVRADG